MLRRMLHALTHGPDTEPAPSPDTEAVSVLAQRLHQASVQRLGRSLALRHLDSGSCNACELELHMLGSVIYDLERLGLRFVASPRHADVLLVTGPVTRNLHEALLRTHLAMPDPKWIVAIGDCAANGGVFRGSDAVLGGLENVLPIDLAIPGCPPSPRDILAGLHTLVAAHATTGGNLPA